MNNERNLNEQSFVYFGIDKITLGMESRCLNYTKSPDELRYVVDIVNHGIWSKLHIQLEINGTSNINPYSPWCSILYALQICNAYNLFTETMKAMLTNCINGIYSGFLHPYSLIIRFFDTRIFTLDEYELYFDFYGYNPIMINDDEKYKVFQNSVYSMDYREKRRPDGELKSKRRSMLCFYKRGIKIGSPYQINRLEFRICGDRAKVILNPNDLFITVPAFIETHSHQIKQTLSRYIPENSIKFDIDYISQNIPILGKILKIF